jgi:hypothetical protein
MRARPNLSGDRLIQDYLHKVAAAARTLPKGDRIAFVSRTKAQIERRVSAAGAADPGQVMVVLAALGTPEELVRQERLRIDSKWLKSRGRHDEAAAPVPASVPRGYRRLNSRWRPAARPMPQAPSSGPDTPPLEGKILPDGVKPGETDGTTPPPWPGDLEAMMRPGPVVGEDPGQERAPTPLDKVWELALGHRLESGAVVLIGLGGALLPFPFWLVGALVAMFSRLWDGRDKLAALGGPVLVDLLGSVVSAVFMGGTGNFVVIYTHALFVGSGLWLRLGCVLTAVYLGWRVSKGRRVKIPPWKRQIPSGDRR